MFTLSNNLCIPYIRNFPCLEWCLPPYKRPHNFFVPSRSLGKEIIYIYTRFICLSSILWILLFYLSSTFCSLTYPPSNNSHFPFNVLCHFSLSVLIFLSPFSFSATTHPHIPLMFSHVFPPFEGFSSHLLPISFPHLLLFHFPAPFFFPFFSLQWYFQGPEGASGFYRHFSRVFVHSHPTVTHVMLYYTLS